MEQNNVKTLSEILNAIMTVSVKGTDTLTLGSCMQALQQVIQSESKSEEPTEKE